MEHNTNNLFVNYRTELIVDYFIVGIIYGVINILKKKEVIVKINNVSVSGVNVNNECDLYNKLTTKVEYVIHMKNEFSDIF